MTNGFEKVSQQQARLAEMRQQIVTLAAEDQQLGEQVAQALADGSDATKVRARRAEARQLRADLAEAAALLEARVAADREAAGKAEAERRMTGIAKAFGSIRQELDEDEAKLQEAAAAYKAAADRVNQRFRALAILRAEAGALSDRFGVSGPALSPVVLPCRREACVAASRVVDSAVFLETGHRSPSIEQDVWGQRRRDFKEIADTPAYSIIMQAGLKPFPAPTAAQVEARQRQEAQTAALAQRVQAERPLVELHRAAKLGG